MKRKTPVQTTFDDDDLKEVVAAAKLMGVTPATFIRVAALRVARGQA